MAIHSIGYYFDFHRHSTLTHTFTLRQQWKCREENLNSSSASFHKALRNIFSAVSHYSVVKNQQPSLNRSPKFLQYFPYVGVHSHTNCWILREDLLAWFRGNWRGLAPKLHKHVIQSVCQLIQAVKMRKRFKLSSERLSYGNEEIQSFKKKHLKWKSFRNTWPFQRPRLWEERQSASFLSRRSNFPPHNLISISSQDSGQSSTARLCVGIPKVWTRGR